MLMKKNYVLLIVTFVLWGSSYVASKYVYPFIPPVTVVLIRNALSAVLLAALTAKNGFHKPVKKHILLFILIGFMMYASAVGLVYLSTSLLGASMSALLNTLNPVFISLFAMIFLKEKITPQIIIGIAVSLIGVVLVLGVSFESLSALGITFSIAAVLLWSIGSVLVKKISAQYPAVELSLYMTLGAVPFNIIYSAIELHSRPMELNVHAVLVMLYIVILGGFLPNLLWNNCLSKIPASTCSMFYPVQPLAATLLGILILGEELSWNFFIGGLIICIGVVIGLSRKRSN